MHPYLWMLSNLPTALFILRTPMTLKLPLAVYGDGCALTHVAKGGGERNDRSNLQTFLLLSLSLSRSIPTLHERPTTGQMSVKRSMAASTLRQTRIDVVCLSYTYPHKWRRGSSLRFLPAASKIIHTLAQLTSFLLFSNEKNIAWPKALGNRPNLQWKLSWRSHRVHSQIPTSILPLYLVHWTQHRGIRSAGGVEITQFKCRSAVGVGAISRFGIGSDQRNLFGARSQSAGNFALGKGNERERERTGAMRNLHLKWEGRRAVKRRRWWVRN